MDYKKSDAPVLSIVVAMYNEENNIEELYNRIRNVMTTLDVMWELVCVDDGSKDQTLFKLINLSEYDQRVKLIVLSRNFGKEHAITAGLKFATGEAVIPIDADLQDPPEVIRDLYKCWKDGYEIVNAVRSSRIGESSLKKITSYLFYRLYNRIANVEMPKDTGDFRLISRNALNVINELSETRRFMKGLFAWVGFSQSTVYYVREPRFAGKTKWNYFKLWNFALEGITSFSVFPLQLASYFGFLISLISFGYGIYILIHSLIFGVSVPGYTSTVLLILFLGGVQLLSLGIIGEYIGRIYEESKRRPPFIIKFTRGIDDMPNKEISS